MLKAVREAKVHTSWVSQNAEYEDALYKFIDAILADAPATGSARCWTSKHGPSLDLVVSTACPS